MRRVYRQRITRCAEYVTGAEDEKCRGAGSQNKDNQEHHYIDDAVILNWILDK
jgi:hypothetical protein